MSQPIPRDERHLIYHKATHTEHGVMPAFYIEVDAFELPDALAAGGVDVTESLADQQAYQRQVNVYWQCHLGVA